VARSVHGARLAVTRRAARRVLPRSRSSPRSTSCSATILPPRRSAAARCGTSAAATRAWADYLAGHFTTGRVAAEEIATVYARAGATAQALTWLERAAAAPSPLSLHLAASPDLDGLRGHPRFRALMRRMGIIAG
jgi:hypothetical protein